MPKYTSWAIYGKDERGNFTLYLGDKYQAEFTSQEHIEELNALPELSTYTVLNWDTVRLPTTDYRWGRFRDPEWRARERGRFTSHHYEALPWDLEPITDHFAHISIDKDTMVAYTPDEAKGMVDLQVRMKAGRYLTKFYPHLTGDQVRAYACQLDKANEVHFVSSADDFERVYTNGPSSCMAHDASDYSSDFHPVRVYAAGDLELAYLASRDLADDEFRASARCLVWPARKLYGRIYGDETRLAAALANLGYTSESLRGAKLLKVESDDHPGRYILPYVDGCQSVTDRGDHFTIGGDMCAGSTDGLSQEAGEYCDYYGETRDEEMFQVRNGRYQYETWCESAVDDNAVRMSGAADGEIWSERYFDVHGATCERTNVNLPQDETVCLEDTEETVSIEWAQEHAYYCDEDGTYYAEKPETDEEESEEDEATDASHPDQLALPLEAPKPETVSLDAFRPGVRVRFAPRLGPDTWAAQTGATATVGPRGSFDGQYVDLIWDRNGLDGGQGNGGYWPADLEILPALELAA